MKLNLERYIFTEKSTIGRLSIAGVFECFTLEDRVREPFVKIPGETAIPAGTYHVIINMSNRFKRMMPLLVNVPEFAGVRIHSGNVAADTEGCILVGFKQDRDRIIGSRQAFDTLFLKLQREFSGGQAIEIEIVNNRTVQTTTEVRV